MEDSLEVKVARLGERMTGICTKFRDWKWMVTGAIAICAVMFSVAAASDSKKDENIAAALSDITTKLHQIDVTIREVQTTQQYVVKQLEEHKKEAREKKE